MVYSTVPAAQMVMGSSRKPRHVCEYVDRKGLAGMLISVQLAGVTPEVNLRITQVKKHAKWDPPWL